MTSKNESNEKLFFSFVSIIASLILGLFNLSITPRNGTNTTMCHYSKVVMFNTH